MYSRCPKRRKRFKYALDVMEEAGERLGKYSDCGAEGGFIKEGRPSMADSMNYKGDSIDGE